MSSPRKLMAAAVLVGLGFFACSDEEPLVRARPTAQPTIAIPVTTPPLVSVSPPVSGECAVPEAVDPTNRISGPLVGDVTGDAVPDHVYLTLVDAAPDGCRLFVHLSAPVNQAFPIADWDPTAGVTSPTLHSLVQIDGQPGAEIVVNLAAGASTQFVGAFAAGEGTFDRITAAGDESTAGTEGLFAFGGSVGHLEAVDCTTDGRVVLSSAIPKEDRYQVSRRFFRPSDATLALDAGATRRAVVTLNELEDFPEFAASPFGTCPSA